MLRSFLIIVGLFASLAFSSASAAPFSEGFRKCGECHEAEVEVWKQTKHAKSLQPSSHALLLGSPMKTRATSFTQLLKLTHLKSTKQT